MNILCLNVHKLEKLLIPLFMIEFNEFNIIFAAIWPWEHKRSQWEPWNHRCRLQEYLWEVGLAELFQLKLKLK
jgi:hypothetical protein